jgi:hypothetical protein
MPVSASGKNVIRAKQVTPKQQAKNQAANRAARLEEKRDRREEAGQQVRRQG